MEQFYRFAQSNPNIFKRTFFKSSLCTQLQEQLSRCASYALGAARHQRLASLGSINWHQPWLGNGSLPKWGVAKINGFPYYSTTFCYYPYYSIFGSIRILSRYLYFTRKQNSDRLTLPQVYPSRSRVDDLILIFKIRI